MLSLGFTTVVNILSCSTTRTTTRYLLLGTRYLILSPVVLDGRVCIVYTHAHLSCHAQHARGIHLDLLVLQAKQELDLSH